jgi:predicted GH43/DUF377 family glycosyl hydrolase
MTSQFVWEKLGKVFDPTEVTDRPWLREFAQAPCVLELENTLRVFFSCRPAPDEHGQYVSYSAWLDLDKSDLRRITNVASEPVLALGARGTFDEFGTYPMSVIRVEDTVYAYYGGWTRCESVPFNVAIGAAISEDNGATFKKLGTGPVLSYTQNEPFVLSGPKIRRFKNSWYLFYIAGEKWKVVQGRPEPVYKIRLATSNDGLTWQKLDRDLIESVIEPDEAQASPDVFFANGRYHMFFCYRYSTHYRGHERGYRIGYASSDDLVNWRRDDNKAGITVSSEGWDSEMISYPHLFEHSGTIYMAYLGNQVGRYGFGIAKLKGDLV